MKPNKKGAMTIEQLGLLLLAFAVGIVILLFYAGKITFMCKLAGTC